VYVRQEERRLKATKLSKSMIVEVAEFDI